MIAIVDYGMGNLFSVQKALARLGWEAEISADPRFLLRADGVVLPGVGAFGDAMANLRDRRLVPVLQTIVQEERPLLGICIGLQLLFTESEENGRWPGMNILPGKVKRFAGGQKVPHMGWNTVQIKRESPLFKGIPDNSFFYFVHSYYAVPEKKEQVLAETSYGETFPAAVSDKQCFALQFHPEKSGEMGLKLLQNFGELVMCS